MPRFYAATHLTDRSARTGASLRRVIAFDSRAERDAFVADYPTCDCVPLRASALTRAERARLDALGESMSPHVVDDRADALAEEDAYIDSLGSHIEVTDEMRMTAAALAADEKTRAEYPNRAPALARGEITVDRCVGCDEERVVRQYENTYTTNAVETVRYCIDCALDADANVTGEIIACVPVAERVAFARLALKRATETNTDAGLFRSARARVDIPALHESAEYTDVVRGGFVLAGTVLAVRRLAMFRPTVEITFANGDRHVSAHADESAILYTDVAADFSEHTATCGSCAATFRVKRSSIVAVRNDYADAEHPMTDAECAVLIDCCLPCVALVHSLGEIVTDPNGKHVAEIERAKCQSCDREYPAGALRDFSAIDEMPVLVCASCVADADAAAADDRMMRHAIG